MQHVSFNRMDEGTWEDYGFLSALEGEFILALPVRLLTALTRLEGSLNIYQISRLAGICKKQFIFFTIYLKGPCPCQKRC